MAKPTQTTLAKPLSKLANGIKKNFPIKTVYIAPSGTGGYHPSYKDVKKNNPGDYSIEAASDKPPLLAAENQGFACAIDPMCSGETLWTISSRVDKAFRTRDPRIFYKGKLVWREYYGQKEKGGNPRQGYSPFRRAVASAGDNHDTHIHLSVHREFIDIEEAIMPMLDIMMGVPLKPTPDPQNPAPVPNPKPDTVAFVPPAWPKLVMPKMTAGKPYAIYKGKKFNPKMITFLWLLEQMVGRSLTVLQGSFNGGVDASGGTHDGADAADLSVKGLTKTEITMVLAAARVLGGFASHRTPDQGPWGEHIHIVRVGSSGADQTAKDQITKRDRGYLYGLNGLKNAKKDNGPQVGIFDMDSSPWAKPFSVLDVSDANLARKYRFRSLGVMYLQNLLSIVGPDSVAVDGDFGPATQESFDKFRGSSGEVDLPTVKKLITEAQKKFSTVLPKAVA